MQSGEWVVVDVRPASRFAEAHPTGAVNVELYQEVVALPCHYSFCCECNV